MGIRIRIRIQEAKPTRVYADPDPGQTFKSQKSDFLHEKYGILKVPVGNRSKNIHTKVQKPFWEKTRFIFKFWTTFMLLDPDPHSQYESGPDPRQPNEWGSEIHNTVINFMKKSGSNLYSLFQWTFTHLRRIRTNWDPQEANHHCLYRHYTLK